MLNPSKEIDIATTEPTGIIANENPNSAAGQSVFALVWCCITVPLFLGFTFLAHNWVGGLVTGALSLLGFYMLFEAEKLGAQTRKFGDVRLLLENEPVIGGRLEARVAFPRPVEATMLTAELSCRKVMLQSARRATIIISTGDSDSQSREPGTSLIDQPVHTSSGRFPVTTVASGASAPVLLELPVDLPASDLPQDEPGIVVTGMAGMDIDRVYHRWELRVTLEDVAENNGSSSGWTFRVKVR